MINGVTQLIMMKADVLSDFDDIYVCTHYQMDGETIDYMPYDIVSKDITPIYKKVKGWKKDLTKLSSMNDVPQELTDYIEYLEQELNVPITIVSVGPDRTQTIYRDNVLA